MLLKLLHPGTRAVVMAKPHHLVDTFKGYLHAAWDCPHMERQVCACDKRPFEPTVAQLDEARVTLAKLEAGIAAAEEKATRLAKLEAGIAAAEEKATRPATAPAPVVAKPTKKGKG